MFPGDSEGVKKNVNLLRLESGLADSETSFTVLEIHLLFGGIAASENIVSVRKSPEPFNYRQVTQSVSIRAIPCIVEFSSFFQTKFLHRQIFGMSQRKVKKGTLLRCEFFIRSFLNTVHS